MKTCEKCGDLIPSTQIINGKRRVLSSRKFCLICSPWGLKKTSKDGKRIKINNGLDCTICRFPLIGKQTKFCSKKCKNKNIKGGIYSKWRRIKHKKKAIDFFGGKCLECGETFPMVAFSFHYIKEHNRLISQIIHYAWNRVENELNKCLLVCSNCHHEIHFLDGKRRQNEINKEKAIEYLGGECHICGYSKCVNAMCFHHIGNKNFAIGCNIDKKWDTIKDELKNCLLLCSNCHRILHYVVKRIPTVRFNQGLIVEAYLIEAIELKEATGEI